MSDSFRQIVAKHAESEISDERARELGKAAEEPMESKYKDFIAVVLQLMKEKTIDPDVPDTFVKQDIYEGLSPEMKKRADMAIVNIAHQLRLIVEFYQSTETPNESPQLVTMIEQLWHMKEPIEREADVFVF